MRRTSRLSESTLGGRNEMLGLTELDLPRGFPLPDETIYEGS